MKSGWSPFPLPAGQKYPPPDGTTGHVPDMDPDTALELFADIADTNIGIRAAGDVLGIDVDQYGDKRGADTLAALVDRFGPLPDTYRSTRRGADNPSGIRFYRVPTGRQWKGKAGADIEIIQRTHRYAVVWPSRVDGRTYEWFGPDGAVLHGVPLAEALPELPAAWVAHLTRGTATPDRTAPRELDNDPRGWLADNVPGYTDAMSSELARLTAAERLAAYMSGNGHDGLLSVTKHVVRLAIEGHAGLGAALDAVETAFRGEVTGRRSASDIDGEVFRAVAGEVAQVREELAAGALHITPYASHHAGDMDGIDTRAVGEMFREKRRAAIDATPLSEQHTGQARWAYILAEHHAGELLYVSGIGWHFYDGARWVEDRDAAVAKRRVLALLRAGRSQENVDRDALYEIASCERASGLAGVLSLASALEPFHCTVDDLDADPNLLNVANGTVDLLTCELRPHDPADRITKVTRAAYRPEARSPVWERFLESSLPDVDTREFLQRYVGYALSGRVTEHVLVILIGAGRNGKGVFYGAVTHALGSYAGVGEPELFLDRKGAHPTGEMDLRGLRLVTVSETGQGAQLANGTVKRLVGGDRIKARRMRMDFVEFEPSHSPLLVTNHLPKVRGDDPALWARLRVVPFDVVIPEAERRKDLPELLELDADAILAWALSGRHEYRTREDLAAPEAVRVATEEYQRAEDAVTQFLEQVTTPGGNCLYGELYQRWVGWAERNDYPALKKSEFRAALDARGVSVRTAGANKQNTVFGYTLPARKLVIGAAQA